MNVQLAYLSKTGHSKKIAIAIKEKTGIEIHDIKQTKDAPTCDLLFIVSGVYAGKTDKKLMEFANNINPQAVQKVCLITSSAMNEKQGQLSSALLNTGVNVCKEEYLCKGSFLLKSKGHPNQDDINAAIEFVKKQM